MSAQTPVQFINGFVNFGNAYDSSANRFCTAKKGFYWFHFDTFTDDYLNANYSMTYEENNNTVIAILKTGTNYSGIDVLSQDTIVTFGSTTCLQMTSLFATTDFTSSLYVMTWTGFFIESEVVFNLATNMQSIFQNLQINFSFITLNFGKCGTNKLLRVLI